MLFAIELCLTAVVVAVAYSAPNLGALWFSKWERRFGYLAHRRGLAVLCVGSLALAVRLAVLPVAPIPQPAIHDEFSHLLLADTLAHGRLASPTHPMWIHFESFHINHQPTYSSMYFPAQGLFLAAGEVLAGHPFWGVWLSLGLMSAAICWMLQGWVPPGWALLGGFLSVVRLAAFSYWANSYYGGAVPAIGGALVLGALPRIKRCVRLRDALCMGLGVAILVNSRPYESFFACLPVAASLILWMSGRHAAGFRILFRRFLLPLGVLLIVTAAAMGYYFWRTTGSPFRLPYQVNIATYHLLYFPWEKPKPPAEYHHAVMRAFYTGEAVVGAYGEARHNALRILALRWIPYWTFFFGPLLTLPFAAWIVVAPWRTFAHRSLGRKTHFLVLICAVTAAGMVLPIYIGQPHYAAPLTCVFYGLVLQAMRYVKHWKWNSQPSGIFLVRAVPLTCLLLFVLRVAVAEPPTLAGGFLYAWGSPGYKNLGRAYAMAKLAASPGDQLAIVRYKANHDAILDEWVYNEADIDKSKVVWARDMGPKENAELLHYFPDRHVWLVEPDETPPRVTAYDAIHW